jgi:Fur family ferric uptake transcriptional regulator
VDDLDGLDSLAAARLAAQGQRFTSNRRDLLHLLAGAGRPLTIPDILERRAGLAQSSVYRNLAVLEQFGLVQRLVTTGEWARYELAEDLSEHHHHLICSSCGTVRDVAVSATLEAEIHRALTAAASAAGFVAQHHRLDLVGVCASCRT